MARDVASDNPLTSAQPAPSRRLRAGLPWIHWSTGYLYLLPALIIYAIFVLLPILDTLRVSFYDWDGLNPAVFVSLANYARIIADPDFLLALGHNLYFILFNVILPICIGLAITAMLTRRPLPGMTFFRVTLFLPQIIPITVIGVAWTWLLNPAFGPINQTLQAIGLEALARPWLGDFVLARPVVGLITTWMTYGLCLVLFLAGVQRIDTDLYDAAEMDGANEAQQFMAVTLPGLRYELGVALVITLIATLRLFGLIFVTTKGGPGKETTVLAFQLYQVAFVQHEVGYGAAIAVVLTLLIVLLSAGVLWLQNRWQGD